MRKVRWGRIKELDLRFRPGSPGYNNYPLRLKHLHSWRTMHAVSEHGHTSVRMSGTRQAIRPSSNMPLEKKNEYIRKRLKKTEDK